MASLTDMVMTARKRLAPPAEISAAEWVENNVRLPQGLAAVAGPVRLWPLQAGLIDAMTDPTIERVSVLKSARLGYSFAMTAAVLHYVHNDPTSIVVQQPVEADCRDFMLTDFEPIVESSPTLQGIFGASDEADHDTITARRFPAGSLKVLPAKSPRAARRITTRVLFADEIDAFETSAEGDPLLLMEKRTLSFSDRKIIVGSTPTATETSRIIREYEQGDQRQFQMPCPHCGAYQFYRWKHVQWSDRDPQSAALSCEACGALTPWQQKNSMVAGGKWVTTRPEIKGHASFWANAISSTLPNCQLPHLVEEFLRAKERPELLKTFVNTILGEGFSEGGEQLDFEEIAGRAQPFGLNDLPEILTIHGGADVQHDRIEVSLVGRDRAGSDYVLGHFVFFGSPMTEAPWHALDELRRTTWRHPWGGMIGIDAIAIDSGDGNTSERVYSYSFPRAAGKARMLAIKGMSGSRPLMTMSKTPIHAQGLHGRLWLVGTDGAKQNIYSRLANAASNLKFSKDLELSWFEQVASERLVVKYTAGQPSQVWTRIVGRQAEGLDCLVYALACQRAAPVNMDHRETEIRNPAALPQAKPRVIRTNWSMR